MATGMSTRFPSTPPFPSSSSSSLLLPRAYPTRSADDARGRASGYGRGGEEEGRREEEGLAFNYLGFPRREAIHLRVYAIFEGRGRREEEEEEEEGRGRDCQRM